MFKILLHRVWVSLKGSLTWNTEIMPLLLLLVSIAMRFWMYVDARSLWYDEAMLARNIVDRNFHELLSVLDYEQGAPVLFLWIVKGLVLIFGSSEAVLRFLPMIASIGGCFLVYAFTTKFSLGARLFVIAAYAFAWPTAYYAQEFKQYIVDSTFALLLIFMFSRLNISDWARGRNWCFLMFLGIAGIWLSHAAVFVVGAVGLSLIWGSIGEKSISQSFIILGCIWILNFLVLYLVSLVNLGNSDFLNDYWSHGFLSIPRDWNGVVAIWNLWCYLFEYSKFPKNYEIFVIVLFFVGLLAHDSPLRKASRLIGIVFVLTLLAAVLQRYPFLERLVLFLVPLVYVSVAAGMSVLLKGQSKLLASMITLFFLFPFIQSANDHKVDFRYYNQEIVPLLEELEHRRKDNDIVYIHKPSRHPALFYRDQIQLNDEGWVYGKYPIGELDAMAEDIKSVETDGRLWLLISHRLYPEEKLLLDRLPQKPVFERLEIGASLYLFENSLWIE